MSRGRQNRSDFFFRGVRNLIWFENRTHHIQPTNQPTNQGNRPNTPSTQLKKSTMASPINTSIRPQNADQRALMDALLKKAPKNFKAASEADKSAFINASFGGDWSVLQNLAHTMFEDGMSTGVSSTCRTPIGLVIEVLQDANLFPEGLEELIPFPKKGKKGNAFNKYHFIALARVVGAIHWHQVNEQDEDDGAEPGYYDDIYRAFGAMVTTPHTKYEFFKSEGKRKRTKAVKVVKPTLKKNLAVLTFAMEVNYASREKVAEMRAILDAREEELDEEDGRDCVASPVPEDDSDTLPFPEDEPLLIPEDWIETPIEGEVWWEDVSDEGDGALVRPCADVSKAKKFKYADENLDSLIEQ